ncbi:TolB-like translocation protein [Oleiphilus messinensis]|uniref:hypothetical protein n=1 Tax=Oleiphilus messinensis TaxID=141451 RepID=UPI0012FCEC3D|nr:hypothetical protein [Oleiphilus messinensis]
MARYWVSVLLLWCAWVVNASAVNSTEAVVVLDASGVEAKLVWLKLGGDRSERRQLLKLGPEQHFYQMDHHPEQSRLAIAYQGDKSKHQSQGIYILDYQQDTVRLEQVTLPAKGVEYHFAPLWSQSARYIYYVSAELNAINGRADRNIRLLRLDIETGLVELISNNATSPVRVTTGQPWQSESSPENRIAPSHVSESIAFVYRDEDQGRSSLMTLNPKLNAPPVRIHEQLAPIGELVAEGSSPWIYFLAFEQHKSVHHSVWQRVKPLLNWFVPEAQAHPGERSQHLEWWRVHAGRGELQKLPIKTSAVRDRDISRDGKLLAYTDSRGIMLLDLERLELKRGFNQKHLYHLQWARLSPGSNSAVIKPTIGQTVPD